MSISRRNFIASGAAAGAAMMTGASKASAIEVKGVDKNGKGVLNLSSQDGVIPGKTLEEKLDKMEKWGFVGVEFWGGKLWERVEQIESALKGRSIRVSAICAGFDGAPAAHEPSERRRAVESIKKILPAAGELGSTGLIIVPAFNSQTSLGVVGARYVFMDIASELGDAAKAAGTRILLEPLNRGESWYLRQLSDAAAICKEANNPGLCMMGDFYHMGVEEPCDYAAFISCRNYVHHVHLASRPHRKQPGYDQGDDFRPGFRALKEIGYQDFCSLECGIEGKPDEEIPKAVAFLRQQWEES
ncbi:MAG: sugar phosphate isomerase/epimerase family protein [Candidatus Omnitrophota bacterium]